MRALDFKVRAGVHICEIEMADGAARGIAVHIGARIAGLAGPSEVLVFSTSRTSPQVLGWSSRMAASTN